MTVTTSKMTYAEFLNFDDGSDYLYELENGELIQMASESEMSRRIKSWLFAYFLKMGFSPLRLSMSSEIVVASSFVGVRVPDLMIFSEELARAMEGAQRSLVTLEMSPPILVVEVVSPNQEKRDYRYKRSEYATRGIPEYWIIDPISQKVTVLEWVEGMYEERVFQGGDRIVSSQLANLSFTAQTLLSAGADVK